MNEGYLLDTHVLLWAVLSPERLGAKTCLILRGQNPLWVSPISVWEIFVLEEKGRLELKEAPRPWVERQLKRAGLQSATLNLEIAMRSRELEILHQDPADRFIAATAEVYGVTLITADQKLLQTSGLRLHSALA